MIPETTLIAAHGKAFVASIGLLGIAVADASPSVTPGSAEDYLIKGGGATLIIFLVRMLLKAWDDHKLSMADHRKSLETTIAANTAALNSVNASLEVQIRFFDGIGQDAIRHAMGDTAFSLQPRKPKS